MKINPNLHFQPLFYFDHKRGFYVQSGTSISNSKSEIPNSLFLFPEQILQEQRDQKAGYSAHSTQHEGFENIRPGNEEDGAKRTAKGTEFGLYCEHDF